MPIYYVPHLGPSIPMTQDKEDWARRIGAKIENREFTDLERAKAFADRIHSRVTDKAGKEVFHDARIDA